MAYRNCLSMSRYRYDADKKCMLVLNEKTGRWVKERKKAADTFDYSGRVNFMPDIAPFVSRATEKTVEITSRSQLRRYERSNGIRQCGDFRPGEVIAKEKNRKDRDMREASRLASDTRLRSNGQHFKWV